MVRPSALDVTGIMNIDSEMIMSSIVEVVAGIACVPTYRGTCSLVSKVNVFASGYWFR